VDAGSIEIAQAAGKGSADEKQAAPQDLLARATRDEQRFLARLVMGELRQGALEGLSGRRRAGAAVQLEDVRRALMMVGDLPQVAKAALTEGASGLSRFSVQLFRPVLRCWPRRPRTKQARCRRWARPRWSTRWTAPRIQVHKSGDDVRVFSRRLNESRARSPSWSRRWRALPPAS